MPPAAGTFPRSRGGRSRSGLRWHRADLADGWRTAGNGRAFAVLLTKYSHSCVRAEADGVLVIDPGSFAEREALVGADAVLITHEHSDHLDVEKLANMLGDRPQVRLFAHPAVAGKVEGMPGTVTAVTPGDRFEAAGLQVQAYGGWHAEI